jgi:hypothetical protein
VDEADSLQNRLNRQKRRLFIVFQKYPGTGPQRAKKNHGKHLRGKIKSQSDGIRAHGLCGHPNRDLQVNNFF